MVPTYGDFTNAFRFHIGDTQIPGGQVWTDASGKIDPYLQQAYSELYKGFEAGAVQNIKRTLYGAVPAYTSYLSPANFGAKNFSEPVQRPMWERALDTFANPVSDVVIGSGPIGPIVDIVTTNPHGLAVGDNFMLSLISGVSDNINDQWTAAFIVDPNTVRINGLTITGTFSTTPTSGYLMKASNQSWTEVTSREEILSYPQTPGGSIRHYAWIDGAFRLLPATTARQVKLEFYLSGKAPVFADGVGTSLGFDDSLGFLAYRAAALASRDRGYMPQYQTLNAIAIGANGTEEGKQNWGGLFGELMRSKARSAARNKIVIGPYRNSRRNTGFAVRF